MVLCVSCAEICTGSIARKVCNNTCMNSRDLLKQLFKDGFQLVSIRGSHHKLRKGARTVIVPHPKSDLSRGTVNSIYKQAGWKT